MGSTQKGKFRLRNHTTFLVCTDGLATGGDYWHCLAKGRPGFRRDLIKELKTLINNAHEDVKRHLREMTQTSLHPFKSASAASKDPARGYPNKLDIQTLKGYFGEITSAIAAETFAPFGITWSVPAMSFRFHTAALDALERWQQTGNEPGKIPGRLGDDCVAFETDTNFRIVKALVCEAKCASDHDSQALRQAHKKLSERNLKPVELKRLIEILNDHPDPQSRKWVDALRELYLRRDLRTYERMNLVNYVCGTSPKRAGRKTWIPREKPHKDYTSKRRLAAVELHLEEVNQIVAAVYTDGST